jgi:hypothetical protein
MIIFAYQDEQKKVTLVCGDETLTCFSDEKTDTKQKHTNVLNVIQTIKNSYFGVMSDIREIEKESPIYFSRFIKQTLSAKNITPGSKNYKEVLFTLISNLGKEYV